MGRHASAERRRSVAAWPIVVGVVVLLLVVATVGYFQLTRGDRQDVAGCSGTTVLPVVVAPGVAPAVAQAAQAFNATKPEARSTCVSVSVTTVAGPAAVSALAGGWRGQATPAPALWIADSAADVAALDAADPAMTAGHPAQALATSPVVLAVRRAPQGAPVSWESLAAGSAPVLGISDPAANRASSAALQSLVRGASGTPNAGGAIDAAAVTTAGPALARLAADSSSTPTTTAQALSALAVGQSRYTAVPVLESDLASFNLANGNSLSAVYPAGPTAAAEMMQVPLTAAWVSNAMSDAAAAFDGYLSDAAGTTILTAAHLRTAAPPAAANGVNLRQPVAPLSNASTAVGAALTDAWKAASSRPATGSTAAVPTRAPNSTTSAPSATAAASTTTPTPTTTSVASTSSAVAAGAATTFLVDTSSSMSTLDNGAQRLTWVKSAVSTVVQARPQDSFSLWTFATTTTEAVPLGSPEAFINGVPRSSAIIAALNNVRPAGDSSTYGAIRAAFTAAANDATAPGAAHRVILLTDGSDSTPGLSRDAIKQTVATLVSTHPGLTLNIVGLSADVNELALAQIAAAGGGTFTPVGALGDLGSALVALSS